MYDVNNVTFKQYFTSLKGLYNVANACTECDADWNDPIVEGEYEMTPARIIYESICARFGIDPEFGTISETKVKEDFENDKTYMIAQLLSFATILDKFHVVGDDWGNVLDM